MMVEYLKSKERKEYLIALGKELRSCYNVHKDRENIEKLSILMGDDIKQALMVTAEDHFDPYWG